MGKVCKIVSGVSFVLEFIFFCFKGNELFGFLGAFWSFFLGLLVISIPCIFLFAIGEIIDQLVQLNYNSTFYEREIYKTINEMSTENGWKIDDGKKIITTQNKDKNNKWKCQHCGGLNEDEKSQFCKICGKFR